MYSSLLGNSFQPSLASYAEVAKLRRPKSFGCHWRNFYRSLTMGSLLFAILVQTQRNHTRTRCQQQFRTYSNSEFEFTQMWNCLPLKLWKDCLLERGILLKRGNLLRRGFLVRLRNFTLNNLLKLATCDYSCFNALIWTCLLYSVAKGCNNVYNQCLLCSS